MKRQKTLVILGSGFAAVSLVRSIDLRYFNVTVVSPRNHFLFTPLLPSTTVGTVEFRSIIEPIRVTRRGITYIQAPCNDIDFERKVITCTGLEGIDPFEICYDLLVIAVGAGNNTFGIPGVADHALFLKELSDARAIRERIVACLEQADYPGISSEERSRLLTFVVVGGGPTGVEFAAELHDLLQDDLARSYPHLVGEPRIILFEAAESILSSFDVDLRGYTMDRFRRGGIEVRTGTRVVRVAHDALILSNGETIPAGLIVWSTGYAPTPLVSSLGVATDPHGRLLVDDHLRLLDQPFVYALGDCAVPATSRLPQTAQVAMQQGRYVGRALSRAARDKSVQRFRFRNLGMLAYVGEGKALADIPSVHFSWKGFLTFLFWRSAYLTRLVSLKNKVLVFFDWFKTFAFGRDLSRF